jgi:hypothetical protein
MRRVWIPLLTGLAVIPGCARHETEARAVAAPAMPVVTAVMKPPSPTPEPKSRLVQVALYTRVGQMRFDGKPLVNVFEAIRTDTGQNVFVNWRALKQARVTRNLPVTTDLSSLTLAEALDKLLAEVGGSQERLGYVVDDGVITVSTQKDLARNTITRVYDVRELLKDPATRDADLAALTQRVQGFDPLSWKDAGGEIGSIRELSGQLIITQTPEVHKRIAQGMEELMPDQERQQFPMLNTRAEPAKK